MDNLGQDPAVALAEAFKRKGYLDKLKLSILTEPAHPGTPCSESLEHLIKGRVQKLIRDMVAKDESLLFKNRGSTSAVLEAQLFKSGYNVLNDGDLCVDKLIDEKLHDPTLTAQITELLKQMKETKND
ncbi:AFR611Cp [Eremothecium gossypii ATCC 10895]|uniref:AFR611Cp n=1 Tax=Eremothecium gossypii (strain ATCC 10895 / CBS 109.51 / FGSC 9923 / NRRL Y-1056) TaxID=284811 RepID=Q752G5_EREGS|nr:AFR611Cp [Eremothecium gossypii ATCC 10895]AAS53982.1 AFR611Cp [Eremothecium gossypii ATCC 10895]AEY98296.1 FAFR611Cp [Eremothecium gossypii FDAG1]